MLKIKTLNPKVLWKLRCTLGGENLSGNTYIYMAFAEHPFVGDGTSPVTAR